MPEKEVTATTEKKTGKRKWLSRIGKFLMYGGVDAGRSRCLWIDYPLFHMLNFFLR